MSEQPPMISQTPSSSHTTVETLERQLAALAREHQSLIREVIQLTDYVDAWLRAVSDAERGRVHHLRQRLLKLLIAYGVRPTARPGDKLDLRHHEVIETVSADGAAAETIIDVVQMGYEWLAYGRDPIPLRQAKVTVAAAGANSTTDGDEA